MANRSSIRGWKHRRVSLLQRALSAHGNSEGGLAGSLKGMISAADGRRAKGGDLGLERAGRL